LKLEGWNTRIVPDSEVYNKKYIFWPSKEGHLGVFEKRIIGEILEFSRDHYFFDKK
jgi:hypothetical protein